jgi:transcriptional regulator of acetoin/glycerol metabolism
LGSVAPVTTPGSGEVRHQTQQDLLLAALNRHHWKIARAAAALGISRTTLWRRIRELELDSKPTC